MARAYWLYFLVGQFPEGPLGGLALTVALAVLGLGLAMPVGLALGLARVSPRPWLRRTVTALVFTVRGTPLLMVVFWAYFFLPSITGVRTGQFPTMLAALVVFDGAYLAEIVAAGIRGVPRGQVEAARSTGLSAGATMRWVVLPQALRAVRPSLINQFASTIKETSLGYIIGLSEVSFVASQVNTLVMVLPAQIYLMLAATYFVLCFGLSRLAASLAKEPASRAKVTA
jgi:polar amino acid transport system permease protein